MSSAAAAIPELATGRTRDKVRWLTQNVKQPGRVRRTQPVDCLDALDTFVPPAFYARKPKLALDLPTGPTLTRKQAKERVRQNLEGFAERQRLRNEQRAAMLEATRDDVRAYQKAWREANKGNK